jgi:hypothetical protein
MPAKQVVLKRDKECKGSVRFITEDPKAPVTNVYLSREHPGCNEARSVVITIETSVAS